VEVLRAVRQWGRLVSGCVIEEFGHTEVEATSTANPQNPKIMETLFAEPRSKREVDPAATSQEQTRVAERNKLLEKTERVNNEKTFSAFSPAGEQHLVAELVFMRTLRAKTLWHLAGSAWVTGLLPHGGLVYLKDDRRHIFVLKTYNIAALCWPAEQVAVNLWRKARNCNGLEWVTIFDVDAVSVQPLAYTSPLHLFLEDLLFAAALFADKAPSVRVGF
jgi:hypothetical protein